MSGDPYRGHRFPKEIISYAVWFSPENPEPVGWPGCSAPAYGLSGGLQGNGVPQPFQSLHETFGQPLSIKAVEVIIAQVVERLPCPQERVASDQQCVCHSDNGSLFSLPHNHPVV